MRSVWVHVVVELDGASPVNGIIWGEVPGMLEPVEVAHDEFGPFDGLWVVARWWYREVNGWRPPRLG